MVNVRSHTAQYPTVRIAQSALHFTSLASGCSSEHHVDFSGKDKHDEVGRKTPKYTQHLPNECRQARLLQQQQERHINNYWQRQ